ncbi:MAG: MFS transporter [Woeseiaceae bacterium]|nr:MFS transporter [Woeseiaceae bacterium]
MNTPAEEPYPSPRYAWYVVVVLFIAYTSSFIDRIIMSLLVEPIKRDLVLSDTQFSLLHGFAFAIFYTLMGLPLGRLADRANRCRIISVGIFLWSIMTAVCGITKTFTTLFLARIGVGVGEAALSPAAYSMISDYFPKEKRAVPISMYSMAVFFGGGIAFILGGYVVQLTAGATDVILPVIGPVRPWQLTFFVVGLPGLLVLLLMLTVREPVRRDVVSLSDHPQSSSTEPTILETLTFVWRNIRAYGMVLLGTTLLATTSYGFFSWSPAFLMRTYGWQASDAGYAFGLIVLTLGTGGTLLGGILANRQLAQGVLDSNMRVAMYSGVAVIVFGCSAPLMPTPSLALMLLAPTVLALGMHVGLAPAALNFITPNQLRGQVIALYLFVLNLIGLGAGPTIVAVITDYGFGDTAALRYSLSVFAFVMCTAAIVVIASGLGVYRERAEFMLRESAA